jgi:hypothetical protein
MTRRLFASVIAALVAYPLVPSAWADNNMTACGTVLCLAGVLDGGAGGSGCSGYERAYFSIVRYRHGHFDLSGTSEARADFLNQCGSVDSDQKSSINSKWGGVESGP